MHKIFIGVVFISLCGLGGWYLANPDMWNKRGLVQRDALDHESTELPLIEPDPVPSATISLVESQDSSSCSNPSTSEVTQRESIVYRWTDASGQIHFGDEKPPSESAELYDVTRGVTLDYFDLQIDYRGEKIVPFMERQISAQATSIYEIMAKLVGNEPLRHVQLNVVIFSEARSFRQYAQQWSNNTSPTLEGVYLPRTNEAVTYTADDDSRTMEVARHEATHVIARGILGAPPIWLNEGFAEYFSKLSITGQLSEVISYDGWPQLARATVNSGYPATFADFLKLSHEEWHGRYQANHYALSWGLVYFLMGTDSGRKTLATLMQEMADQYCQPLDSAEALGRLYPGGLFVLETEFYAWLRDDTVKAPHTY